LRRDHRPAAVLAQTSIAWAIDSIAIPHLNNGLGTIIRFPGEISGLGAKTLKT
jgi:hypothetical protein